MRVESAASMVEAATSRVENFTPREVASALDEDAVLVDIREPSERDTHGRIHGSITVPSGMLELWADPASRYHRPEFDTERRIVIYSASGVRSASAADTMQRLGYRRVAHLDGGLQAWTQAGYPVEP